MSSASCAPQVSLLEVLILINANTFDPVARMLSLFAS